MWLNNLRMAGFSRIDAIFKIKAWAGKAKSFSFTKIRRENYSVTTHRKNKIVFEVQYFSTKKEGKYQIPADFDYMSHYADGAARGVWLRKRSGMNPRDSSDSLNKQRIKI